MKHMSESFLTINENREGFVLPNDAPIPDDLPLMIVTPTVPVQPVQNDEDTTPDDIVPLPEAQPPVL